MFKRIDHVELIPSDIEKTIKFYTEILGFTLSERKAVEGVGTLKEYVYLDLGHCVRAEIKDPDGLPIELMQW